MKMLNRWSFALVFAMVALGRFARIAEAETVLTPAVDAVDVCADTPLHLRFAAPPVLAKRGKVQVFDASTDAVVAVIDTASATSTQTIGTVPNFKYYPVTVEGDETEIHLPNGTLDYGKSYYVTVDAGTFEGDAGIAGKTAWKFSTKKNRPAARPSQEVPREEVLTIAADGSGDFATVQGAIDSIPDGNVTPTRLFIRKGVYTEQVCFLNKHAISLVGEDRKATVIQYANNNNFNNTSEMHIYHRGVFIAHRCNNIVLTNLTIRNTTPQGGSQAEAIILNGTPASAAVLTKLDLYSYQDTLQINGQAYIADCAIEGDVDFMWGNGPSFFENCECRGLRSKAYYTQIRNPQTNHGFVYYHCTFDTAPKVSDLYLSRIEATRFPYSEVVLMECVVAPKAVSAVAWKIDQAKGATTAPDAAALANIHFWEYNSHTPDGSASDVSGRFEVSRQLDKEKDAELIGQYSDPVFVLGNHWDPRAVAAVAGRAGDH